MPVHTGPPSSHHMSLTHHRPIASPGDNRPFICAMALLLLLLAKPRCAEAQRNSSSTNGDSPYNTGLNNFNPSMAIVIVVLISAFFFLGFFSIYIRQCTGDGDGALALGARNAAAGRSRRQRGLDPAVLETFPTLVYSEVKGLKIGKSALECAVCLSEFDDDETLRLLPACSHVFHPDCIDAWLASHVTCPVCRADLTKPLPDSPPAETDEHDDAAASSTQESDHVAININDGEVGDERPVEEAAELKRLTSQRQALRAKSVARPARFPRSHSTGHSVAVAPAGPIADVDRYTLRLPDHVRREIVAAGRLQRTKSCVAFPANEGSTRRGWRLGGGAEGSSRGGRSMRVDRWPSFLVRTISVRMPAWAAGRKADGGDGSVKKGGAADGSVKKGGGGSEGEGSTRGKISAAVRAPFECLGGGGAASSDVNAATNESPTTPFARV